MENGHGIVDRTRFALNRRVLIFSIAALSATISLLLFSFNIIGLFKDVRYEKLEFVSGDLLRFQNEDYLTYEESLARLEAIENKKGIDYAHEANLLVQRSLSHIEWNDVDPVEFRQKIPIWENYLLHFVGYLSDEPQLKRYHFVDYKRSLERGIGVCGDASMVLSQIMKKKGIKNQIVSFNGHVINQASFDDEQKYLFDPDFGVALNMSLDDLVANPERAFNYYVEAGYSDREARALVNVYKTRHTSFDNVFSFMPKRYVFEYASYVMIWVIPTVLLLIAIFLFHYGRRAQSKISW